MVAASQAKARLFGLEVKKTEVGNPGDFTSAQSTQDLAKQALKDAGLDDPTANDVEMAILEMGRHAAAIEAIASRKAATSIS